MPSDLIYREDAKDYARHAMAKGLNVLQYLDEAPAAEFRPAVHGQWNEESPDPLDGDPIYVCSVCGETWNLEAGTPKENNMNFCPNCGADMRPMGDENV